MQSFQYPAVFARDKESGGFVITFPDLPEAITQGEDLPDAIEQAADCLEESYCESCCCQPGIACSIHAKAWPIRDSGSRRGGRHTGAVLGHQGRRLE